MAETYTIQLSPEPTEEERDFIVTHLRAFNDTQSPAMQAMRGTPPQRLHVILRAADGTIMGGLIASIEWHWLDIGYLWLDERARGQDYGTQLIRVAEDAARQRGCTRSKVGTFSFQARGFYEKMGYRVVGQIDDYPPGATDYTLVKEM